MRKRRLARGVLFVVAMGVVSVSCRYSSAHLLSDVLRLGVGAGVLGVALRARRFERVEKLWSGAWPWLVARADRVVDGLALFVLAAGLFINRVILEGIPHVSDEVAYLFQARVFAAGHLSLPAPAMASFFPGEWVMTHQGRWFAIFPPGWPAILAIGQRLGAPWLVNPALTALALVVVHALARELIGREGALGVALLCAASPFFLFMGGSAMSHPAALIFTAGCVLALVRATVRGSRWWFAASGACAACAVLVRPLDALVVWGAAALALLTRARTRRQLAGTLLSATALAPGVAAYVLYNRALSGRWLVSLLDLTGTSNRLAFGADVGPHGHDLWQAALNLNFNLAVLSADMLGWPVSSLCFAVGLLALGRLTSAHRLMVAVVAAYCAAYALFWYHGVCFGARLYFTLLPFFLMLTVDGMRAAGQALGASRVVVFVALCFGFAGAVYWPVMSLVRPYRHFRNVDQGLRAFMAEQRVERSVVFVGPNAWDYGPALLDNALDPMAGPLVFAVEAGADDARLAGRFPDCPVLHYTHRSEAPPAAARWLDPLLWRGQLNAFTRRLVSPP